MLLLFVDWFRKRISLGTFAEKYREMAEGQKYVNLLSDAGFKAVFGDERNKKVVISFLNIILDGERVVTDIEYMSNEVFGETTKKKAVRYDLSCMDESGARFVVEMQRTSHDDDFFTRSVFYGAKAFGMQVDRGRDSYIAQPVYVIGIMEGHLEGEIDGAKESCISRYDFLEKTLLLSQRKTISLIFVQLGFFRKEKEECLDLIDQWLYCLKHIGSMEGFPESFSVNDGLPELYDASEIAAFDEAKKMAYIAEEMTERDYQHDMYWSRKKGFDAGVAQGREDGFLKGILEVALKMLKNGMPIPQIVECTGLTEEQVLALSSDK